MPIQTPSKMVHFDAQLEHVKLFKSEQKPAAVSRDGSPDLTTDTEGEESGVEYFGFRMPAIDGRRARSNTISISDRSGMPQRWKNSKGRALGAEEDEESVARRVSINRINFSCPPSIPPTGPVTDCTWFGYGSRENVALASLELRLSSSGPSATSSSTETSANSPMPTLFLVGTILVRNLAFAKRVAVRFTLDDWQTVSEVSAKWIRSVDGLPPPLTRPRTSYGVEEGKEVDLFEFNLKLSDHLLRIATKTLVS